MIDYNGLKTIFGEKLPEPHIFFATVAAHKYVPSYAFLRRELGLSSAHTNRKVWKKFVEAYGKAGPVDVVPGAPTLQVTPGENSVTYTITDGTNTGSPITQYKVYYTDGTTPKTHNSGSSKTGTISTLEAKEYTFQAVAVNGAGESPKSAAVKATPTAPGVGG